VVMFPVHIFDVVDINLTKIEGLSNLIDFDRCYTFLFGQWVENIKCNYE
jgi:hypothetical protein